jgi:hypothetical protein
MLESDAVQESSATQNRGVRQQDRYLVNYDKGFIIKKIHALELLRDLKIKIHNHPERQVHFVDVFKALIKRIFTDKAIDYKLSPNLNKKVNKQWEGRLKGDGKESTRWTAEQE